MYEIGGFFVVFFFLTLTILFFIVFQQRQKSREQNYNSFLSDLEAKYSKKSGKSKRGKK